MEEVQPALNSGRVQDPCRGMSGSGFPKQINRHRAGSKHFGVCRAGTNEAIKGGEVLLLEFEGGLDLRVANQPRQP
jgi:hypothetical protein